MLRQPVDALQLPQPLQSALQRLCNVRLSWVCPEGGCPGLT